MTTKWFVPGRIEVLGKHTDYAGGRSLLCAVERGFTVTSEPRDDNLVYVFDGKAGMTCESRLAADPAVGEVPPGQHAHTVVARFARNFPHARRGAMISLDSDLPMAAGLSSSSAMMIALFLALADTNDLASDPSAASIYRSPEALAGYLAAVENGQSFEEHAGDRGVGTSGGSEDHTAILCCTAGSLAQYAFCPVRHERAIALDPEWAFAIGVSGASANKTGAQRHLYNAAARSVREILEVWREATGRGDRVLADALASDPDASERLRQLLASGHPELLSRLEQFIEESHIIVPSAGSELAAGNFPALGALVDRSQELAERALGNQIPETIELARSARRFGAAAASAFGAGFGGSVWALVRIADAERFVAWWSAHYRERFPGRAASSLFFLTRPGRPAHRIE